MNFSAFRLFRFCIANSTSKVPPRINNPASHLNANEHIYDRNSNLKRQQFIQKEFDKVPIIVEKALPEDEELIVDFYVTHFAYNEPLNATLKHTPEESHELMSALVKESTDNFILRNGNKIIGMYTLKKGFLEKEPTWKVLQRRLSRRLEDYGQLVDTGPFKHRKNNIIVTLLEASEKNMYDRMEAPCTYYYGMMGALHPKYLGKKIAEFTLMELMKFCITEGGKYYCGDNTGDLIAKLYCKLPGFEVIDKFYYADFKVHGESIIDKLIDGTKNTSVIFCDLKKHEKDYFKK